MQSFHITSIKDVRVVEARELTSVAGRARFQKTLLEGEESIQWALEAHLIVEHVFYSANLRLRAFLETLQARGIACYAVSEGILKKISDTSYLVPVIGIARLPAAPERSLPHRAQARGPAGRHETEGISDEMLQQADVVVKIPMSGTVESLNGRAVLSSVLYSMAIGRLVLPINGLLRILCYFRRI